MRFLFIVLIVLVALTTLVVWPHIDLVVSGWFYRPEEGFFLRDVPLFDAAHNIAYGGARLLGMAFLLLTILAASWRRPVAGLDAKAWLFLLLALLIGPGLVANGIFKDHWGRARPREVTEFGGDAHFTPALVPADQCSSNCSFVSGDGAFGFFLPVFAYVVPFSKSRRYFWGGIGLGVLFSVARLAAGAHFLSDNLFAGFFMLGTLALLHGAMYSWQETRRCWRLWLFFPAHSTR